MASRLARSLAPTLVRLRGVAFALLAHAARFRRRRHREALDLADDVCRRGAEQLLGDGRAVDLLASEVVKRLLAKPHEVVMRLLLLCRVQGSNDGVRVAGSHEELHGLPKRRCRNFRHARERHAVAGGLQVIERYKQGISFHA